MAKPPFHVKALYEYSSPHEDDLGFPSDQVITVTEEEDADWYYGEYEDASGVKREGLFPRNFVKMYEPETPPRPSRLSRSRKDLDPPVLPSEEFKSDRPGPAQPPTETSKREEAMLATLPTAPQVPRSVEIPAAAPPMNMATKPTPSVTTKPPPPPVTEKPVIGSFRDRINAFNKPAAPVAPTKPGALGAPATSSFIKKPFIAPPPSKNAYIPPPREPPPQRFYRREEDPEIINQSFTTEFDERAGPPQIPSSVDEDEDLPKPTSLKERIALLQKQQREQAARHAESAQKKEKPKRPPKKRMESQDVNIDEEDQVEGESLEGADASETLRKHSVDVPRDEVRHAARSATRSHKSREATPLASPTAAHLRDFPSDANDADQSGAGDTEDGEEASTGRDDSDEKPRRKVFVPPHKSQTATPHSTDVGDEEDTADEDDQEEEVVDPEVKRRMEIRERMAKMSGGMGMAGMFGPPGGISPMVPKKQGSKSSERKASDNSTSLGIPDTSASRAHPVSMVPIPGLQRVRSPEHEGDSLEVGKGETGNLHPLTKDQDPDEDPGEDPNMEDRREPLPVLPPVVRAVPPSPMPQNRPLPITPVRETPSSLTTERPQPPSRADSRQIPLVDSAQLIMSPSEGSESDDEMSLPPRSLSLQVPGSDNSRPTTRDGPPPIPSSGATPSLPSRPLGPQARYSSYEPTSAHSEFKEKSPVSPTIPMTTGKRSSRVPPIPGSSPIIPPVAQSRAPPPLPPNIPAKKIPTDDSKGHADRPKSRLMDESEEEITEYEGDYDTDMAPGATRKPSLKSHGKVSSLEDDSMAKEGDFHHSGLPSLGPPISVAPRAVPPPPPSLPPRNHRQSSDMPRAPPPPPPPSKEPTYEYHEGPDPNTHPNFKQERPLDHGNYSIERPQTPSNDDPDGLYSVSPPRHSTISQQPLEELSQYEQVSLSAPGRAPPRKSLEVQQASKISRGSTDGQRASLDQSYMATDIDLGQDSQWWAQPNLPPPALQNRRDIIYEIEETSTTRRGGKQTVTKTVYILYMDYSQTKVSAHFEPREPTSVNFEQQHDSPPTRLRQDQLEGAHTKFGLRISEGVNSKKETVVGDGTPQALVEELVSALPEALPPVGVRAYGALVYANLANATVQQFDEIRSGDIITFRNAKFQGHKGPMKSKYAIDVGKPDHIGIVVDWDGTKKKVRAWEQGRESKKVRIESFRLSDMRSGEVKVWRVMARNWVGWGQS